MAIDVVMPRLSDSMEEGTVLRWLKSVGDEVKRGDELVEIETDKANMTYEATDEGTLIEILADEGDNAADRRADRPDRRCRVRSRPATEVAGRVGGGTSAARAGARSRRAQGAGDGRATGSLHRPGNGRVKASPVARRMARDLGRAARVDPGLGPRWPDREGRRRGRRGGGGVQRQHRGRARAAPAAPSPQTAPEPRRRPRATVQVIELTRLQRTVARRMAESKATVPHFYLEMEIDMTEAVELRARLKEIAAEDQPIRPTTTWW